MLSYPRRRRVGVLPRSEGRHGSFTVKILRGEILEAIRQARSGKGLIEYNNVDEFMTEFGNA